VRAFAEKVGVARREATADAGLLESAIREDLEATAHRRMAVLRPLKVVLTNMAEGEVHSLTLPNHPDPAQGTREVALGREVWIEREDFMEVPAKKWFRLAPGAEVRLKGACLIRCEEVVKDAHGEVIELRCTWDPASLGGDAPDGRKVKGTLHWVSAAHGVRAEVRLYDRLFTAEDPMDIPEGGDWRDTLNPASLEVLPGAQLEAGLATATPGDRFQFERLGYFCVDPESVGRDLVFNRTVGLKDSWAKAEAKA
jgi:glutaminyl-tRNA synthetase